MQNAPFNHGIPQNIAACNEQRLHAGILGQASRCSNLVRGRVVQRVERMQVAWQPAAERLPDNRVVLQQVVASALDRLAER